MMPNSNKGGAETVAFNIANTFLDKGHHVCVYSLSRGKGVFWTELQRHRNFTYIYSQRKREKFGLLDLVLKLPQIWRLGHFDLLYTSHVNMNALASILMSTRLISARYLVSRESTRIFDRFSGMKLAIYRLCYACYREQDLLICQTEEMRTSLLANVSIPDPVEVVVLPNPISRSRIDSSLAAKQLGEGVRPFCIVFAGRLIPLKRVSMILNALSLLRDRTWNLTILGQGPLKEALETEATTLGIAEQVTFAGQVDDPFPYYRDADLGVLVSEVEGFPNVVLEMMASGAKHLIVTPCTPAIRQLAGVEILEDQTAEGLAVAIARSIKSRSDSSQGYREFVNSRHSAEGFIESILSRLNPSLHL